MERMKIIRVKIVLVILVLIFVIIFTAEGRAEQVYYSVHYASFLDKEEAWDFLKENQTFEYGIFIKKASVLGYEYWRIYLGKFDKIEDALSLQKKLSQKKAGTYEVHELGESKQTTHVRILKESYFKRPKADINLKSSSQKNRFKDNEDGTITDTATGLMWVKNGRPIVFFSSMSYHEAMEKVNNYNLAKYNDWKMPSLEELISIVDPSNERPAIVAPNPFVNMVLKVPYWTSTGFDFTNIIDCTKKLCPFRSWVIQFFYGTAFHLRHEELAYLLPVRDVVFNSK